MTDVAISDKRYLRDLAALIALPAIWLGHGPSDIVRDLVRLLVSVLNLESTYVCFVDPNDSPPTIQWYPEGAPVPVAFARWLDDRAFGDERSESIGTWAFPESRLRIVRLSTELPGEFGYVLAAAARPDFPTERELHLLRVAISQATIAIRIARMVACERDARLAAEAKLARQHILITTLAQKIAASFESVIEQVDAASAGMPSDPPPLPPTPHQTSPHTDDTSLPSPYLAGRLTRRETEVLGLLAQGLSNKQIAAALWVSDRTVERHITSLHRKMGVHTRTEAVTLILRHAPHDDAPPTIPS